MRFFSELQWFFREQWHRYVVTVLVLCAVALLQTQIPQLIGQTIDIVLHPQASHPFNWFTLQSPLLRLFVIGLVIYLLRYIWRICLFGAAYRLGYALRQRIYQKYLALDQDFHQQHHTGELIAHISNDIQAIEMTAGEGVLTLVDSLFMGCLVLYIMCTHYSIGLTLFALIPLPVMAFLIQRLGRSIHEAFAAAQAAFGTVNNTAHEQIMGLRTLRLFAVEAFSAARMAEQTQRANNANMQVARTDAKFEPVIYLCIGAAYLFAIIGGSYCVYHQQMTLGELTSFSLYLGQLIWPMFAIAWLYNILERGHAAYLRIRPVLMSTSSLTIQPATSNDLSTEITSAGLTLQLSDTSPDARIQHLYAHITAGSFTGIVGPTGSGKSSLLALLQRFYDPQTANSEDAGKSPILLNDRPITHYPLHVLRSHFAYVPQDPYLFSLTIADNIALGLEHADMAQIEQAARLAAIHDEIMQLPLGYQTMVGERGITLSGGQKQRISIARAWLMKRPYILLDDALSAVDAKTAVHILQNLLHDADTHPTLLMVTHRLQELQLADHILVLQHGRLAEQGTHTSLIQDPTHWYSRIWHYQQLQQQLESIDA
jgi:ATP-binding cassette subfamily B multidrug efflux pump